MLGAQLLKQIKAAPANLVVSVSPTPAVSGTIGSPSRTSDIILDNSGSNQLSLLPRKGTVEWWPWLGDLSVLCVLILMMAIPPDPRTTDLFCISTTYCIDAVDVRVGYEALFETILSPLLIGIIFACALQRGIFYWIVQMRVMTLMGRASFAFYLCSAFGVIPWRVQKSHSITVAGWFFLFFFVITLVSQVLHHFFETPLYDKLVPIFAKVGGDGANLLEYRVSDEMGAAIADTGATGVMYHLPNSLSMSGSVGLSRAEIARVPASTSVGSMGGEGNQDSGTNQVPFFEFKHDQCKDFASAIEKMSEDSLFLYQTIEAIKFGACVQSAPFPASQSFDSMLKLPPPSRGSVTISTISTISEVQIPNSGSTSFTGPSETPDDDEIEDRDGTRQRSGTSATTASEPNLPHFRCQLGNPRRGGGVIEMKIYCPEIFADIRMRLGVSNQEFVESWCYTPDTLPALGEGAGRSGSLFMHSKDKKYLFKTIPHHEALTLLAILPDYQQHLISHPTSRLMRFVGLHRIKKLNRLGKSPVIYIAVGLNILFTPRGEMHVKFDLKGRRPKRSLKDTPSTPNPKGMIWKDNQLARKFYLGATPRKQLLAGLQRDVAFLQNHDCIDYSLLIGVFCADKPLSREERSPKSATETKKDKTYLSTADREDKKEEEKRISSATEGESKESGSDSMNNKYDGGVKDRKDENWKTVRLAVRSLAVHRETYFIGIIDFLSRYHLKKKTAHFFKSQIWDAETLSTVNPKYYADRFNTYLPTIFPTPTADLEQPLLAEEKDFNDDDDSESKSSELGFSKHGLSSVTEDERRELDKKDTSPLSLVGGEPSIPSDKPSAKSDPSTSTTTTVSPKPTSTTLTPVRMPVLSVSLSSSSSSSEGLKPINLPAGNEKIHRKDKDKDSPKSMGPGTGGTHEKADRVTLAREKTI